VSATIDWHASLGMFARPAEFQALRFFEAVPHLKTLLCIIQICTLLLSLLLLLLLFIIIFTAVVIVIIIMRKV